MAAATGSLLCRPVFELERSIVGGHSNQGAVAVRGCSFLPPSAQSSAPSSSSSSPERVGLSRRAQQQAQSWRGSGKKQHKNKKPLRLVLVRMSVDIDDSAAAAGAEGSTASSPPSAEELELIEQASEDLRKELESRKKARSELENREGLEERFLVVNSGKHECRSCGFVYNSEKGDSNYPISAGVAFSDLPEDWRCPTCGAAQSYFQNKGVQVAGFVQNQSYGLGGNSLTEGQKSLLIYGSLVFFFALFLSGYFLQ